MAFNAEKFLATNVDIPMSTHTVPCPEGEFKAFIDDGDKAIQFKDGRAASDGKVALSPQCTVMFAIVGDQMPNQTLKRDKVLVPMNCWLDLTDDGESLDFSEGKNVSLGRLRLALGMNDSAWTPLAMKGRGPVMIKVGHRADKDDPETRYAEVRRVAPITV